MDFCIYRNPPIDLGWETIPLLGQFLSNNTKDPDFDLKGWTEDIKQLISQWAAILPAFIAVWMNPDHLREWPRVFTIPHELTFLHGFAAKAMDNGTTFIASPIRMPHLEDQGELVAIITV